MARLILITAALLAYAEASAATAKKDAVSKEKKKERQAKHAVAPTDNGTPPFFTTDSNLNRLTMTNHFFFPK